MTASTSTSYSNLQETVHATPSAASSTVLAESFPWLAPSIQSSPQLEVSVTDTVAVEDDDLGDAFAAYADVSDEWATATWEATSETWPEY